MSPSPSPKESDRTHRAPWAHLLKRVFDHDLLTCDKCGGRREVGAFGAGACLCIYAARRTSYQPTIDAVDSAKPI
jgi:hypothetical protein